MKFKIQCLRNCVYNFCTKQQGLQITKITITFIIKKKLQIGMTINVIDAISNKFIA